MQAKLQSAADAASVASISQKSSGYLAATQMTGDGSITAGVTDANNVFDGNMSTIGGYTNLQRTSTVTKDRDQADVHRHVSAPTCRSPS